jgi:hypothetical protein
MQAYFAGRRMGADLPPGFKPHRGARDACNIPGGKFMHRDLLAGVIGAALALSPYGFAQQPQNSRQNAAQPQQETKSAQPRGESDGVQQAIAFQRAKDRADARQAKLEQRHPSVDYSNADRSVDDSTTSHHLPDPGPAQPKKDKKQ